MNTFTLAVFVFVSCIAAPQAAVVSVLDDLGVIRRSDLDILGLNGQKSQPTVGVVPAPREEAALVSVLSHASAVEGSNVAVLDAGSRDVIGSAGTPIVEQPPPVKSVVLQPATVEQPPPVKSVVLQPATVEQPPPVPSVAPQPPIVEQRPPVQSVVLRPTIVEQPPPVQSQAVVVEQPTKAVVEPVFKPVETVKPASALVETKVVETYDEPRTILVNQVPQTLI